VFLLERWEGPWFCLLSTLTVLPPPDKHDECAAEVKKPKPPQGYLEINQGDTHREQCHHAHQIPTYDIGSGSFLAGLLTWGHLAHLPDGCNFHWYTQHSVRCAHVYLPAALFHAHGARYCMKTQAHEGTNLLRV